MHSSNDNPRGEDGLEVPASPVGTRRWIVLLVAAISLCVAMIWWVAAQVERKETVAPAHAEAPADGVSSAADDGVTEIRVASALPDTSAARDPRVAARVGTVEILTADLDEEVARYIESRRRRGESPSWARVEQRRGAMLEARIERALVHHALAPTAARIDPQRVQAEIETRVEARFGGRRDRFERYLMARGERLSDVELEVRDELALRDKLLASGGRLDETMLARTWQTLVPTLEAPARVRVDLVSVELPSRADASSLRRHHGDARALQRTMSTRRPGESLGVLAERYGAEVELEGQWAMSGQLPAEVERWLMAGDAPRGGVAQVLEPLEAEGRVWVARLYEHRPAGVRQLDEVRDLVVERAMTSRLDTARHQLAQVSAMTVPVDRADALWHRRVQRRVTFERGH